MDLFAIIFNDVLKVNQYLILCSSMYVQQKNDLDICTFSVTSKVKKKKNIFTLHGGHCFKLYVNLRYYKPVAVDKKKRYCFLTNSIILCLYSLLFYA